MSLSLNHPPPQTTTFKSLHNTKIFNSSSTISLSELNAINNINNSKLDKLKENQNINNTIESKNYHTLMKPISSSQLLLNKTNKINENSSHFFANLQKPEALYESKVDLPKIESVSVAKIKPECFNFLNKNDQFVMYGATSEEQSLTYCI
jgi:hypothetical protein